MELHATTRTILGKKVNRLRKEGFVPAEIFGHGFENKHVSVQVKEFIKVHKAAGENTIITLDIDSKEKIPALITYIATHHLSGEYLTVDFYHIRKDEKIKTHIPITYTGADNAVKSGFLLMKVLDHVEIEALPDQIPHTFEVDISSLSRPGQSIEVKDIMAVKGVKILTPHDTVIATVAEKAKEEDVPPQAQPEEGTTQTTVQEKQEGEEK